MARRHVAAHRPRLHERRQRFHGPREAGIECRPGAEIGDRGLQGLNLSGEFRSRRSVAGVFELECTLAGVKIGDVALGLPGRADADEHGQRHDRAGEHDRRPGGNRHTPDDAGRAVCDENGVAPGWFQNRIHSTKYRILDQAQLPVQPIRTILSGANAPVGRGPTC